MCTKFASVAGLLSLSLVLIPLSGLAADLPKCTVGNLPQPGTPCLLEDDNSAKALYQALKGKENEWSPGLSLIGNRFVVTESDRLLRVVCLRDKEDDGACLSTIEEKPRETVFIEELKKVIGVIPGLGAGAGALGAGTVVEVYEKCLTQTRATITIKKAGAPKDASAPKANCSGATQSHDVVIDRRAKALGPGELTLYSGPTEHLFVGAQLPMKEISELKYDSASNTVVEKEKPSSFLIGINYGFGDILTDEQPWYQRFFVSLMVAPSSKPLKEFGGGLGLRLWKFTDWLNLSGVTIFGGKIWTEGDEVVRPDGSKIESKYTHDWQWGVGFNANKVVDWLKKDKKEAK